MNQEETWSKSGTYRESGQGVRSGESLSNQAWKGKVKTSPNPCPIICITMASAMALVLAYLVWKVNMSQRILYFPSTTAQQHQDKIIS